MANKDNKAPGNISGKYYVDDQCIDCGLCRATADDFFGYDSDSGCACVIKQPSNDEENDVCVEAMEQCPVSAIGDDGE